MQYHFLMLTLMSVAAVAKPMPKQTKESVISERDPHAKREVHEKKKRRGKRRAPAHSELVQIATTNETPYIVSVEEGSMTSRARSAEVTPRTLRAVSHTI